MFKLEELIDKDKREKIQYYGGRIFAKEVYRDDKLTILHKVIIYHENGNKQMEVEYEENNIHGKCYWYHEKGSVSYLINFKNGEREGLTSEYYEEGGPKDVRKF